MTETEIKSLLTGTKLQIINLLNVYFHDRDLINIPVYVSFSYMCIVNGKNLVIGELFNIVDEYIGTCSMHPKDVELYFKDRDDYNIFECK